ncbi:MAG: hypothetical protein ACYC5A_06730 [Thermoleophilia bacterium]
MTNPGTRRAKPYHDTPRHLYGYSHKTLSRLLAECGIQAESRLFEPSSTMMQTAAWSLKRARNSIKETEDPAYVAGLPRPLSVISRNYGRIMAKFNATPAVYVFARKRRAGVSVVPGIDQSSNTKPRSRAIATREKRKIIR